MTVTSSVWTSTVICIRPPPPFGIRTRVTPKSSSVLRSNRALGNAARTAARDDPTPTPRAVARRDGDVAARRGSGA